MGCLTRPFVLAIVVVMVVFLGTAWCQHTCCTWPSFVAQYIGFTDEPRRLPAFEGTAYYDSSYGARYEANFGNETITVFILPNAYYFVNTTSQRPSCRSFHCTNCFKPYCIGGSNWLFNETVIFGRTKVEKWSTTFREGTESIFILEPIAPNHSTCLPISDNHIRGGLHEASTLYRFGLWSNVRQVTLNRNDFIPPSICPPPTRNLARMEEQEGGPGLNFLDLERVLNAKLV